MSQLRKYSRSHSARHLSDDYVWDSLSPLHTDRREDSPTFNQKAKTQIAASTSGLPLLADHPGRRNLSQAELLEQPERVLPSVTLPPSATAASLVQSSSEDQLKLRLQIETQDLKIKRLQLELQLAQLKLPSNTEKSLKPNDSVKTGDKSSEKSLGDQRARQRITNPQEWPHIFAAGGPKLFNELSMAEISADRLHCYHTALHKCFSPSSADLSFSRSHGSCVNIHVVSGPRLSL